jgi:hypothetical protein
MLCLDPALVIRLIAAAHLSTGVDSTEYAFWFVRIGRKCDLLLTCGNICRNRLARNIAIAALSSVCEHAVAHLQSRGLLLSESRADCVTCGSSGGVHVAACCACSPALSDWVVLSADCTGTAVNVKLRMPGWVAAPWFVVSNYSLANYRPFSCASCAAGCTVYEGTVGFWWHWSITDPSFWLAAKDGFSCCCSLGFSCFASLSCTFLPFVACIFCCALGLC